MVPGKKSRRDKSPASGLYRLSTGSADPRGMKRGDLLLSRLLKNSGTGRVPHVRQSSPVGTAEEMSHSHVCRLVHVVFATAERRPTIHQDMRIRLADELVRFLALHGRTVSFSRPFGT